MEETKFQNAVDVMTILKLSKKGTVKLGYNKQLGTDHFCSFLPGFVITGLICALK
jgi:hypothetical protein